MTDVRRLTEWWLASYGYDGLRNEWRGCSCDVDGIMPCGNPSPSDCVACWLPEEPTRREGVPS